jgi:hypothetical protein
LEVGDKRNADWGDGIEKVERVELVEGWMLEVEG